MGIAEERENSAISKLLNNALISKISSACCLLIATTAMSTGCTTNSSQARSTPDIYSIVEAAISAGPHRDSTSYVEPSEADRTAAAQALTAVVEDKEVKVPPGYQVTKLDDLNILAEVPNQGITRGWGMAVVRADTDAKIIIEVPHPRADLKTETIGTQLFLESDARALLIAGAHRTAGSGRADVAHNRETVFAAMDEALAQIGWTVIQLHGFAEAKHDNGFDVVLSNSTHVPTGPVQVMAQSLGNAGFKVCVYDGTQCADLAGTINTEAEHARNVGADYLHIEIADSVRLDDQQRNRLVAAMAQAVGSSPVSSS